jgi:hypothetical protein
VNTQAKSTSEEIRHWFFDEYLPAWVAVGASEDGDPRVVLSYWGAPMHAASVNMTRWLMTEDDVLELLAANHKPLKAEGYTHTDVIDRKVVAYNANAGSVDVIWSRCCKEKELERRAVHFEIHRTPKGWRVISLASALTTHDRLEDVWTDVADFAHG